MEGWEGGTEEAPQAEGAVRACRRRSRTQFSEQAGRSGEWDEALLERGV